MKSLSAIIICMNEEDRIRNCLESLKGYADEIIVVDSGSTDNTINIVKEYTDNICITDDWPGYGVQKQRALDKATCEWVLSIDADEWLDDEIKIEITKELSKPDLKATAFKLPWGNLILGKQLKHGRSARAPKRLFKREGARFSNHHVHETIISEGKLETLKKGLLMHNSIKSYEHWITKNRKYSWLTSQKYHAKGKKSYGIPVAVLRALWTFFLIYIIRLGILDGSRGLMAAVMFTQASFNKYAGLWYLEQTEKLKENK